MLRHTIQLDQSGLQAGIQANIRMSHSKLFVNYDCSTYCTNMGERLSKLLAKFELLFSLYSKHSPALITPYHLPTLLALETLLTKILALESTNTTTTDNNDTNDGDTNRMCTKNGGKFAGD
uniref:Uncharacterized protein n=1 Tax=Amphimedon queenslandica TaxID=400682 RepID=A0A1X7TE04_AMPQE